MPSWTRFEGLCLAGKLLSCTGWLIETSKQPVGEAGCFIRVPPMYENTSSQQQLITLFPIPGLRAEFSQARYQRIVQFYPAGIYDHLPQPTRSLLKSNIE